MGGILKPCAWRGCSAETGSEAGKEFSIASSSAFSRRLRSASSLIFVLSFSEFCCVSFCDIFIRPSIIPPLFIHYTPGRTV